MIQTVKYARKPFLVDAVRVTEENMQEVADWAKGSVIEDTDLKGELVKHIKIEVHHPMNERQTKAFVGDWVLFAERGFKIYTNKAFNVTFENVFQQEAPVATINDGGRNVFDQSI